MVYSPWSIVYGLAEQIHLDFYIKYNRFILMDLDELKKYAERAGEVLAQYAIKKRKEAKPVDKAAQELVDSQNDLKDIEPLFNANSIAIIYSYMKQKYPTVEPPDKSDELVKALKVYAEMNTKESLEKAMLIHEQLIENLKEFERKIISIDAKYKPKFL